jgi:hypothetical protein
VNWRYHPVVVVKEFFDSLATDIVCCLSAYTYSPRELADPRQPLSVQHTGLKTFLEEMNKRLPESRDLALHSTFWLRRLGHQGWRHLPLIDMAGEWTDLAADRLSLILRQFGCTDVALYDSGRSNHVYGLAELTVAQWRCFMASLLTANEGLRKNEIIDSCAVGHYLLRMFRSPNDETTITETKELYHAEAAKLHGQAGYTPVDLNRVTSGVDEHGDVRTLASAFCVLLLQNPTNDQQIVDSRWIGHRLLADYSALRWTAHQTQYLAPPRLVARFVADRPYRQVGKQHAIGL